MMKGKREMGKGKVMIAGEMMAGKEDKEVGSLLVLMNRYFRFRQQPMDVLKAGKMPCGGDG